MVSYIGRKKTLASNIIGAVPIILQAHATSTDTKRQACSSMHLNKRV